MMDPSGTQREEQMVGEDPRKPTRDTESTHDLAAAVDDLDKIGGGATAIESGTPMTHTTIGPRGR